MSSLWSYFRQGSFALGLLISPLAFALESNKTDLDYPPASDEARIERSDTDPTHLMDDSPQRRRIQAIMRKKHQKTKLNKKLEASQEHLKAHNKPAVQTTQEAL